MNGRPERWEHTPNAVHSIPGIWGNSLAFLGGPRACIGYRFSVVECVITSPVSCTLYVCPRLTCALRAQNEILVVCARQGVPVPGDSRAGGLQDHVDDRAATRFEKQSGAGPADAVIGLDDFGRVDPLEIPTALSRSALTTHAYLIVDSVLLCVNTVALPFYCI